MKPIFKNVENTPYLGFIKNPFKIVYILLFIAVIIPLIIKDYTMFSVDLLVLISIYIYDKYVPKKLLWDHRSCAVAITLFFKIDNTIFVAVAKRGNGSLDNKGKWNLPCGYMDWNENGLNAAKRELWEEVGLNLDMLKIRSTTLFESFEPWRVHTEPNANRQNITLHYGFLFEGKSLPKLSTENMEPGEVEDVKWMSIDNIKNPNDFAFNHDRIIRVFKKHLYDEEN